MKKKMLFVSICSIMMLSLTSCGNTENHEPSQTSDGTNYLESDYGAIYYPDSLPFDMDYNGGTIIFDSVDVYQTQSASGHGYVLYVVATIDVSKMDEDSLYWFDQEIEDLFSQDLFVSSYITSESNNLDFEPLSRVKGVDYGDKRSYAFAVIDEQKNSFIDSEIVVSFKIPQEETYTSTDDDGDTHEYNKDNSYLYDLVVTDDSLSDIGSMDSDMVNTINEGLDLYGSDENINIL